MGDILDPQAIWLIVFGGLLLVALIGGPPMGDTLDHECKWAKITMRDGRTWRQCLRCGRSKT